MNNPNPFVPKGSLLEQQSLRRSRLKIAVGCVLAVSILGLVAMLIQGCNQKTPDTSTAPQMDTNPPALDLSNAPAADTNLPPPMPPVPSPASNSMTMPPPQAMQPVPPMPPTEPAAGGTEYVVVQGDTLAKIAKAHGVSVKALEAANPGVEPKKLKIKQKLVLPAATSSADAGAGAGTTPVSTVGGESYTVKSGDTLSKIAKRHGVGLKALKAANNLTTDHIKVGDKLVIPAKGDTNAASTAPVPDTAAPVMPPMTPPAPAPNTPAPAH